MKDVTEEFYDGLQECIKNFTSTDYVIITGDVNTILNTKLAYF